VKLAFCLFKFFPFGGLQRDFLSIARECLKRGYQVDVFTMEWSGTEEPGLNVILLNNHCWQNHSKRVQFAKAVQPYLKNYDLVMGFNKMPGLDIYYAADTCYQTKARLHRFLGYRFTARYYHTARLEKAVFTPEAQTHIFLLAPQVGKDFIQCYRTPANRFHLLPPGIAKDRIAPDNASILRKKIRAAFNIPTDELVVLAIGSGFKTKGLDRTLKAMAALPSPLKKRTHLYVIGQDRSQPFEKQAKNLSVHFLGGRNDIPDWLLAADLLVHPAYNENTGTVLLEALVAGLPVITTDICGYAHFIQQAKAGVVLPSPFKQIDFNALFEKALISELDRKRWQKNGLHFAKTADIYDLSKHAVDLIEKIAQKRLKIPRLSFDQWMMLSGTVYRAVKGRRPQRIMLGDRAYFIKQHEGCGLKEILKNLMQLRFPVLSAKNEWSALNRLKALNLSVPTIVQYECQGFNPATRRSFLVTEALDNTVSLEDYCQRWPHKPPLFQKKKQLIQKVGLIARTLHHHGINHRDFYLCHFLLDLHSIDTEHPKIYLIDLHRATEYRKIPARWRIKDLGGLYFSSKALGLTQRDFLRFMKEYCNKSIRQLINEEKHFWLKVKKRGEKLYRKHNNPC